MWYNTDELALECSMAGEQPVRPPQYHLCEFPEPGGDSFEVGPHSLSLLALACCVVMAGRAPTDIVTTTSFPLLKDNQVSLYGKT